jgi:putative transposase
MLWQWLPCLSRSERSSGGWPPRTPGARPASTGNCFAEPTGTSYQSPWQNGVAERFVGTVRQELLDHVIVLNERHLRRLIESVVRSYNVDRTHIGVGKDSPCGRPVERTPGREANVVSLPRVDGLHHRYAWRLAA